MAPSQLRHESGWACCQVVSLEIRLALKIFAGAEQGNA